MSKSELELLFREQAKSLPTYPLLEYPFHPTRRWRLDFAWPESMIALEVEGGVFSGGRHGRPLGIAGDIEKGNAAALLGWRVLRATGTMVRNGAALSLVEAALRGVQIVEELS